MPRERQAALFALFITVVVILYLTLYPFRFTASPTPFDWTLPFFSGKHHSFPDLVSNVIFFVPFGVFSALILKGPKGLGLTFLGALSLSTLVEVLQRYLPGRHPGLSDILTNLSGALLGFGSADFLSSKLFGRKKELFPLFLAFFFLYQPFFLSFDPGEVWHHLKAFSWSLGPANLLLPAFFLGLWASLSRRSLGELLLVGAFLEGGRLFMLTASLSPLKSLLRLTLSSLFFFLLKRYPEKAPWGLALSYLFEAWLPFKLGVLKWPSLFPFETYLRHFSLTTLFQLLGTLFLFALWAQIGPKNPVRQALLLALVAEVGQMFIAGRYPDLTTVFLAGLGAWTGGKFWGRGVKNDL